MVEAGLFDEVRALLASGLSRDVTAMQAIGYKEALSYLDGAATREEAIEEIKLRSRQYAKRQLTWLRRDKDIHWFYWKKRGISPTASLFRQKFFGGMAYPVCKADEPSAKRKERVAMKKSQTFRICFSSLRAAAA